MVTEEDVYTNTLADKSDVLLELQKELAVKEILLSLSKDIAHIRAKMELMQLIKDKFGQLFYFYHCTICILCDDRKRYKAFILDPNSKIKVHAKYKYLIADSYSTENGIDDMVLNSAQPVIFDFDAIEAAGKMPLQGKIIYEAGIKEMVGARLEKEQEPFGFIVFYSDMKHQFTHHQLPVIETIAAMVAPVVANIIATEIIERKIRERDSVLTISDAIASIKDRNELLEVINNRLKQVFMFTHSVALKFSEDEQTLTAFFLDPLSKSTTDIMYSDIVSGSLPASDHIIQQLLQDGSAIVVDIEREAANRHAHDYLKMNWRTGSREFAAILLKNVDHRPLAVLYFYADKKGSFSKETLQLVQSLSYHLTTAILNILHHEKIIKNNEENKTLLAISAAIASIRNKEELLTVINGELKTILNFTDLAISLYNLTDRTYKPFVTDCPTLRVLTDFSELSTGTHPLDDGIHNRVIESESPIYFSEQELRAMRQSHIDFMLNAGIRDIAIIPLKNGNDVLGGMVILSNKQLSLGEGDYLFIQRVSYHIATAISNIIINEELKVRDNEKSLLLAFGKDIASVRDKPGLERVISNYFNHQFNIFHYIITLKNVDQVTHSFYLFDHSGGNQSAPAFDNILASKWPVDSKLFDLSYNSSTPLLFDADELYKQQLITSAYPNFWKSVGYKQWSGVPLRVGNEYIGVLWTVPGIVNKHLLDGISGQIAFAVANILANDKIALQLKEISRYKEKLEEENFYLQEQVKSGFSYSDIIGSGAEMQKVFQLLSHVAFSNSTVLILGETGTGKELIARAIHNSSSRKNKLMVKVNCAALPANLIESELFGHERGSFTGATERRIGKFELANHGSLFLDEIGEMPLDLQVKLLRALQEKEIERVGGKAVIKVDVRIIAATNRNLQKEVAAGNFRSDLFYRLNVFPITLPPLRERREDIPVLAAYFVAKYAKNTGRRIHHISEAPMQELINYSWPGNVRELEHLLERTVLMTEGQTIKDIYLPDNNRELLQQALREDFDKTFEENERDYIIGVLNKCKGKIYGPGGAAEILRLNVGTLNSKIKKLGIVKTQLQFTKTSD